MRMTVPRRFASLATASLSALSLVLMHVSPAHADRGVRWIYTHFPTGSRGYISWVASCNSVPSLASYAPSWKGYMKEHGPSNVKDLKIEYDIYREGTGRDTVKYLGTSYVKNVEEYGTHKVSTPYSAATDSALSAPEKKTKGRTQTSDTVLVIKFTFGRGIRTDTVMKQIVAYCPTGGGMTTTGGVTIMSP